MKHDTDRPHRGAQPGNKNAETKPGGLQRKIQIRAHESEEAAWRLAAGKQPLAQWIRDALNKRAAKGPNTQAEPRPGE